MENIPRQVCLSPVNCYWTSCFRTEVATNIIMVFFLFFRCLPIWLFFIFVAGLVALVVLRDICKKDNDLICAHDFWSVSTVFFFKSATHLKGNWNGK